MTAIEDCYFFMTDSCAKGNTCPFRHSERARNTYEVCPEWSVKHTCSQADCGLRHSTFHLPVEPRDESCFFERTKGACTRDDCPFKHMKKNGRKMTNDGNKQSTMNPEVPVFEPVMPLTIEYPGVVEWRHKCATLRVQLEELLATFQSRAAIVESLLFTDINK